MTIYYSEYVLRSSYSLLYKIVKWHRLVEGKTKTAKYSEQKPIKMYKKKEHPINFQMVLGIDKHEIVSKALIALQIVWALYKAQHKHSLSTSSGHSFVSLRSLKFLWKSIIRMTKA